MNVVPYNRAYYSCILQSLTLLQEHEYSVTDTRVPASEAVAKAHFEDLLRDCRIKQGKILVGLIDQQYVGFVAYCFEASNNCNEVPDYKRYALISSICVHPEFRRQGLGQQLLQAAEDRIKNAGFTGRLRIWAVANNALATSAYARFGFSPEEIVFEKKLI